MLNDNGEDLRVVSIANKIVSSVVSLRTSSLTILVNGVQGSGRIEGDLGEAGHALIMLTANLHQSLP